MDSAKEKPAEEKTSFGFKEVRKDHKESLVREVFSSVAGKYDLMNDLMSGGLHRLWKNHVINMISPFEGAKLLDVAGGTGDIAFRFLKDAEKKGIEVEATISDINPQMLEKGRERAINTNILSGLKWQEADAENLPFEDKTFDYYTIAFGIRNVTNIDKALAEAYRVLKFGGRLVCLEFSHVENPVLAKIYDAYSFNVIPKIGNIITGDKDSYRYLVESIRKFPRKEEFARMLKEAGFARVTVETMTGGIVAIHSGWRL